MEALVKRTQEMKVLDYLKARKGQPVSRVEMGLKLYILDVPKVVSNLNKKGHIITSRGKPAFYTYHEMSLEAAVS